ncbi:D-alanine--D-alanine ligase [Patescibacteria group bacterium]|nr:D-alanine--D-alanine ligase [Patescibacteria group bacterium]
MKQKIKVGIIFGGRSGEHEVSLASAWSIMQAIDKKKYQIVQIGITKQGEWLTGPQTMRKLKNNAVLKKDLTTVLVPDAIHQPTKIDVAFPILHGPYGEDGTIQGLLELANMPYVGSGVLGSAMAMDKVVQKKICQQAQLPVVKYLYFYKINFRKDYKNISLRVNKLGYPVFVKPANMGSSVGISKVQNKKMLIQAVTLASKYDNKIIVEKSIANAEEIEVAVLGNRRVLASVPGAIISSNEFYDYNAKYVDGQSFDKIPAQLPKPILNKLKKIAVNAFLAVNGSGMARVDFLVSSKHKIYLNEINTIPGFTSISMYPKLWRASGVSMTQLISRLIDLAFDRYNEKAQLKTSLKLKKKWY